jgi:hypothetical protein
MTFVIEFDSRKAQEEFEAQPKPKGVSLLINFSGSGDGDIFTVTLNLARDVGVGLVSAWLYDKLKRKSAKIIYRRKEVRCEQGEIRRVIEENLKIGDNDQ